MNFWLTQEAVRALREQGLVPFSRYANLFFGLIGLIWSFYVLDFLWVDLNTAYQELVGSEKVNLVTFLKANISTVALVLLFPIFLQCLCLILFGLLQTKFFFNLSNCNFEIARLWTFKVNLALFLLARLQSLIGGGFVLVVALLISCYSLLYQTPRLLETFNHSVNNSNANNHNVDNFAFLMAKLTSLLLPLLAISLCLAVVLWASSKVLFRIKLKDTDHV